MQKSNPQKPLIHPPHPLRRSTSQDMNSATSDSSAPPNPLNNLVEPFCCQGSISLSFRHLLTLLSVDQTFVPLRSKPRPANPILTSFLTAVALTSARIDRSTSFAIHTFQAIIKVTRRSNAGDILDPQQYYALLADEKFVVNQKYKLISGNWLRISTWDAEECVRPEGSGIMIGNGEDWDKLNGEDKLWCNQHQCYWHLEAWAQV